MKMYGAKGFLNPTSSARTLLDMLAGLVAAGLLAASVNLAEAQTPMPNQGSTIERFSINIPLVRGFCELDPKRPDDGAVIEYYRRNQAGADSVLYRVAVECDRIEDLRRDLKPPLDAHVHLVVWRSNLEQFPLEKRNGWPASTCDFIRRQQNQPAGESTAAFNARLVEAAKAATGVTKIFGIADETPGACHVLAVSRQDLPGGQSATVLALRSTVTVKGRVIDLWHTTATRAGSEGEAAAREVSLARAIVDALPAANP
jgi:hypothetical protein